MALVIWNIFSRIEYYSTAATSDAAYIIGGRYTQDIIAEFRNNQWRQVGSLKKGRYGHGSISLGDQTMIIGGYASSGDAETEVWELENEIGTIINPALPSGQYAYGLGLYIVPFNFCK